MAEEAGNYDFSKRIFKTAWADTLAFYKKRIPLGLSFVFSLLVGGAFYWWLFGFNALKEELWIAVAFVLAPFGLFGILLFLWNIAIAPYKLIFEAARKHSSIKPGLAQQFDFEEPDYDAWDMIDKFTLAEASKLLAGEKTTTPGVGDGAVAWLNAMVLAHQAGELRILGEIEDAQKAYVLRNDLIKFADARNKKPPFLFPEERERGRI